MKFKYSLFPSILLFSFPSLVAHIYYAETWKKGDRVCYCLGDMHEAKLKKNCVNNNNRRDILYAAKAIGASVIVEDVEGLYKEKKVSDGPGDKVREAVQGSRDLLHLYDLLIASQSMLRGTSGLCYRAGVDVTNVEFRFLSAADGTLTLKNELNHLDTRSEKILNYNGESLKPFYAKMVENYRDVYKKGFVFFDYLSQENKFIRPYDLCRAPYGSSVDIPLQKILPECDLEAISSYEKKNRLLELYSTFLIDAELVHAIAQNKDKKRLIVCAGNAHIQRIAPALKAMGYIRTDVLTGNDNDGAQESDAIDLDAFFAKHEPRYAAGEVKKTYIDYLLDMQCYFDKHPLVALATGITASITTACALLAIGFSPWWCATVARNVAPHSPKVRSAIEKSLLAAVMATTVAAVYTLFVPLRAS